LTRQQFILLNEDETRLIEKFLVDRTPLHVLLLLDVSASLQEELKDIRKTAYQFSRSFNPENQITAVFFSDGLTVLQDWTHDKSSLCGSLKHLQRGYRTALFDALEFSADDTLPRSPEKSYYFAHRQPG
jgi:hypothetical protein